MSKRQMALMFVLLGTVCIVGCNTTKSGQSQAKDVPYVGDDLSARSSLEAAMGGGGGGGGTAGCPPNYVRVPANTAVGANADFCVAKYEMKNDGSGRAVSQAQSMPWVRINRDEAIGKCREIGAGYDLISNAQWQAVARSIELAASNWSTNAVGSGSLSRGNFASSGRLEASANDNDPCVGTGESCNMTSWNARRRAHKLSNGGVVWDVAGNVWEWVKDNNFGPQGESTYISQISSGGAKAAFGPQGNYNSLNSGDYGGLGYGWLKYSGGAVLRGGYCYSDTEAGVFAAFLSYVASNSDPYIGFRCVRPAQ